jgi:hypothetical protein
MTLRIRSLPASGATVTLRAPLRTSAAASFGERGGDIGDAGHARHLGADQPDDLALAETTSRLGHNFGWTAIANRTVHEAGRAKAATPLAAATGLDQEHVAEDGFLGENQRRG